MKIGPRFFVPSPKETGKGVIEIAAANRIKSEKPSLISADVKIKDCERCPGCGFKVKMPCVYCRHESSRESERKNR